jgi:hypothetical protein
LETPHYAPLGREIFSKASYSSLLSSFPPFAILKIDTAAISGELPEPNNRNCPGEGTAMYTAFNKEKARMGLEVKIFESSLPNVGLAWSGLARRSAYLKKSTVTVWRSDRTN